MYRLFLVVFLMIAHLTASLAGGSGSSCGAIPNHFMDCVACGGGGGVGGRYQNVYCKNGAVGEITRCTTPPRRNGPACPHEPGFICSPYSASKGNWIRVGEQACVLMAATPNAYQLFECGAGGSLKKIRDIEQGTENSACPKIIKP
jgi:hypothetical protein